MLTFILVCIYLISGLFQQAHAEIIMSEIYPAPSQGYEWVEICNDSDQPISLSSYTLHDSSNKAIFIPQITLQPDQYVLATSSGVLNNTGDSIYLRKNNVIIETMIYDQTVTATQSFVQCNGIWSITTNITPGFQNPSCAIPTAIPPTPLPSQAVTPTKTPVPTIPAVPTQQATRTTPTPRLAQKISTTTSTAESPTPTIIYIAPTAQLFAQKHRPVVPVQTPMVLAAHQEKPTPTTFSLSSPSPKKETHFILIMLISAISSTITGYLVYKVVKKMKHSYNEWHDT